MARTQEEKMADATNREAQDARNIEFRTLMIELYGCPVVRFNVGEWFQILDLRSVTHPSMKEIGDAKFLLKKGKKKPGKLNLRRSGSRG